MFENEILKTNEKTQAIKKKDVVVKIEDKEIDAAVFPGHEAQDC